MDLNELRARIIKELTVSAYDFNSVVGLAGRFNAPEGDVRKILIDLEKDGVVRRPFNPRKSELSAYRLTERGYTKQEKRRRFYTMLSNSEEEKIAPDTY